MDNDNYLEKIFYQDVRNKKRTASGIHHRASRRGYIKGGVKTQSDFMTKKEKQNLNGEVKVYNMYDKYNVIENVPSLNEIERLEVNERINLYKFLKNRYSNSILQKHWDISSGSLYNKVYEKYGLYTPRSGSIKKSKRKVDGIYNNDITNVVSYEELLNMPKAQAKGILVAVRQEFTALQIASHWKMSKATLYKIFNKFEVTKNPVNNVNEDNIVSNETENNIKDNIKDTVNLEELVEPVEPVKLTEPINSDNLILSGEVKNVQAPKNSFSIQFNGEYDKESLQKKLTLINSILEEDSKYKITLVLEEI